MFRQTYASRACSLAAASTSRIVSRAPAFAPRLFSSYRALANESKQASATESQAKNEFPSFLPPPKNTYTTITPSKEELQPLKIGGALYAVIHIHDRSFMVTEGDEIILPVDLRDTTVGSILDFDHVSKIGTREHTLTGGPAIDPSVFSIKGVVVEKTRERRRIHEKTQRRIRHVRHVVTKNRMTIIRISELKLK